MKTTKSNQISSKSVVMKKLEKKQVDQISKIIYMALNRYEYGGADIAVKEARVKLLAFQGKAIAESKREELKETLSFTKRFKFNVIAKKAMIDYLNDKLKQLSKDK